jgi:uncharacterized protein (DUF1778 family)
MHHENEDKPKEWYDKELKLSIMLSQKDFDFMKDMIQNPPMPDEALKRLLKVSGNS